MPAPKSVRLSHLAASNTQRVARTPNAVTTTLVSRFISSRASITPPARTSNCGFTLSSAPSAFPRGVPLSRITFAPTIGLRAARLATCEHRTTGSTSTSLTLLLVRPPFRAPLQQLRLSVCHSLRRSRTCQHSASGWSRPSSSAWRVRLPWSSFFVSALHQQPRQLSTDSLQLVLICCRSITPTWSGSDARGYLRDRAAATLHNSPLLPSPTNSNHPETPKHF